MKVAIVTTRHSAQDDRIYFKQALSLAKRLSVTLIAPDDGEQLRWAESVAYYPIPRRHGTVGRLWSLVEAISAVRRLRPDFCHVHDLDLALALPFIRLLTNAKIIYDSHEVFTRDDIEINGRFSPRIGRVVAKTVSWAEELLVAASHQIITAVDAGNRALANVKIPRRTIFNYPQLSLFRTEAIEIEREVTKYRDRMPVVYHGSMSIDRGLFRMLDAIAIVKEKEPRVLLRLIGLQDASLRQSVEATITRLGIGDHVRIDQWLPHHEIALSLRSCLIGLVPLSSNEKYNRSLPIKLFEYMASGVPVIAARLPLIEKYVSDCECGLLYDSACTEELASCLLELLSDPERRAEMGARGAQAVRDRWNWSAMESSLYEIYESLGASFRRDCV